LASGEGSNARIRQSFLHAPLRASNDPHYLASFGIEIFIFHGDHSRQDLPYDIFLNFLNGRRAPSQSRLSQPTIPEHMKHAPAIETSLLPCQNRRTAAQYQNFELTAEKVSMASSHAIGSSDAAIGFGEVRDSL
jgi:hypothetical protein